MRRRKIKVRKYTDSNRPHLKFVVNYREAGKRKRSFFESKEQAESFAAFKNVELKRNGVEHAEFPTALRIMAQNAVEQLKPFGKTISDAVQYYVAHLRASEKSCTAVQLVKELVAAKESDGASQRHLDDLRSRLNIFAENFNGQPVATITSADIDDWLRSLNVSPVTRNHYRRLIVLAFNFAVQRGYATSNPAEKTAKAKEPKSDIGILNVAQAARLLESATPDILPYIAIGLFAGLRRAEIERLDWTEIDFESGLIQVKAEKAKGARKRFVTIQPNLREWLLPLRKLKGNVRPQENFRRRFDATREAAGIMEWPDNALRHSFASYHLAHFKNAASTALELGHHDSRVTFAHYRELVKPKDAERYWNIRPETTEKIVPLRGRLLLANNYLPPSRQLRPPPQVRDYSITTSMAVGAAYIYPYAQIIYLRWSPGYVAWPEAGLALVTLAAGLSLVSLLALGRLFGVRPALRGLVKSGPYRFVRHPMYLSYVLADIGVNLQEWNFVTLLLVLVGWASLVYRIHAEERLISQHTEWPAYVTLVRYRLFPGLW